MPHIPLRPDLFGITSLLDFRKETAAPICELTNLLLCGESTLSKGERELIAAHVSRLNDCNFCSSAHEAVTCKRHADEVGSPNPLLINDIEISDKMKALLHIAGLVQQGGNFVTAHDIQTASELGASDLEIHDTVLIAALFCLYNRYVDGLATATPGNPAFYEALGKRITSRGYSMPADGYHALQY